MLFANVLLEHIDLGSRAADIVIVKSLSLCLSFNRKHWVLIKNGWFYTSDVYKVKCLQVSAPSDWCFY